MRFLLLTLLLTTTLSAQTAMHVWAKSGLTIRAEGKADGEKIGRLNYGTLVTMTGEYGETLELNIFPGHALNFYGEDEYSKPWSMEERFVEVAYEGGTGWVYRGYLSRLKPPSITNGEPNFYQWLEGLGGQPDTIKLANAEDSFHWRQGYEYDAGISRLEESGEGWGSTTTVIPFLQLSEGFLIADLFFNVTKDAKEAQKNTEHPSYFIVNEASNSTLRFSYEMSELRINQVGGVLVIVSAGGC